ncbi:hypothetical protein QBC45DRAFT_488515 [Copromyces sp. CBS 386.78]|nr:hypothetical protein QBC45DRAFT_488515 [Copromyces sp. CBS 386.78]
MADAATQPTGAYDRGAHPSQAIDLTLIDPRLLPSTGDTPVEPSEPSEPTPVEPSEPTSAQPMEIDRTPSNEPSESNDGGDPDGDGIHDERHPIFTTQYNTLDELTAAVKQWGKEMGYQPVKTRTTDQVAGFGPSRCDFVYSAGEIRESTARSRRTSTAKQGCP